MWKVGRLVGFVSVLAASLVLIPADVIAQKKKKNNNNNTSQYPVATEADYANMVKTVSGKIVAVDSGKSVTLRIENPHYEPNPNYKPPSNNTRSPGYNSQASQQNNLYRRYADLQVQMQRAATARTPQQAMQAQMRIQSDMMQIQNQMAQVQMRMMAANNNPNNQPYRMVTTTKDYELDLEEKVIYRKTFLPTEYDDQGNLKKYTSEEKAALTMSDKRYKATADEVQVGQTATLYLTLPKKKSKTDEDTATPDHPTINKIILTKEAPATSSSSAAPAPKKKKNNN